MKKSLILISIFLILILFPVSAYADTVIIHTNDVHGKINQSIGYDGVAAYISDCKAAGDNVVVLSAGDEFQGDLNVNHDRGATAVKLMNLTGYQAMAVGNHDFDYGWERTVELSKMANFPFLAANVFYSNTTSLVFQDDIILDTPELKIGVFGIATPETKTKTLWVNTVGLDFAEKEKMYSIAQNEVDKLRSQGCDYIICLSHLGTDPQSVPDRSIDLAENVTGIDLILDGHSHTEYPNGLVCKNTLIASTGCNLENIGVVRIKDGNAKAELVSDYQKKDPKVNAVIREIIAEIDMKYDYVVGKTDVLLNGERSPGGRTEETNLGDLIADSFMFAATESGFYPDCAIIHGGAIRTSLPKGEFTKKQVLNVLPSGYQLYIAEVTGEQLIKDLEANTGTTPSAEGGFPQVSGIKYTIDTSKKYVEGEVNRVSIQSVGGKPFREDEIYKLVSTEQLLSGGDKYVFMTKAKLTPLSETYENVLLNYVSKKLNGHVGDEYAAPQGRITVINGSANSSASVPGAKTPVPAAGIVLALGFGAVIFVRRR